MKKFFSFPNIHAALLLVLSITETVLMILFKPLPLGSILLFQLVALLCVVEIRFAYQIAFLCNRRHSFWHRRNEGNDEPSDLAVGIAKASGYIFLFFWQFILFL